MIIRARWLLDAAFNLQDDWALQVESGRIVDCGPSGQVPGGPVDDLGDVLLLPGFVNAHTHLELGHLAGRVTPTTDFTDWLRRLMTALRAVDGNGHRVTAAVADGLTASLRCGVTLVGDIARQPAVVRAAIAGHEPRPAVVSFGEVIAFGQLAADVDERLADAMDATAAGDDLAIGVSPHATYTVAAEPLRRCLARAAAGRLPVCIHAAESLAEEAYLLTGGGPLAAFFGELGLDDATGRAAGCRPIAYLRAAGALRPGVLLAHVNYVTDAEIDELAAAGVSVVYCPRTHAAFDHPPHRFVDMLARGINVGLGTDSLASTPSLSVLADMRFAWRRDPALDPCLLIRMATINGARALGQNERGRLDRGCVADVVGMPVAGAGHADPVRDVLAADALPLAVYRAGRRVG